MLDALRRGATGWLAKILLFLLIFSFAIWGIGDMFVGFGRGFVAKVGDTEISIEEYQRAQQNALANLSAQAGKRITAEEARVAGIDRQVLLGVIGQAALEAQANQLGLGLSNETLIEVVQNDPDFEGPDGRFSRIGFDSFLRQAGLSEAGYLAIRRRDELQQQITNALQNAVAVPPALLAAEHNWRKEERILEHVIIDVDAKIDVPEPDEAKLQDVYDKNKGQFVTPEYRKFSALLLTLDDLKKDIEIADDVLKRSYEETKSSYDKPERRRIQQIVFKDNSEAQDAIAGIKEKGFIKVAEERGLTLEDISLGMITKSQLIDKTVAEAAFGLARDELSEVIDGTFGPVVLRVVEISEGEESTFEGVKDKVRERLATERARLEIQERYDLVEESRNAGKTLKETADGLKLSFIEIEAADRSNQTPDGKTAIDHSDSDDILRAVFAAAPGYDTEAVELTTTEGYAWYNVVSITKGAQKEFVNVKDDAKSLYKKIETERLLKDFAAKLVERLKNGEAFAKVAADSGGTAEKTDPPITRKIQPQGLTKEAVELAFALPEGGAASSPSPDNKSRIVLQVSEIKPAEPLKDSEKDALLSELRQQLREDYLTNYIVVLQDRLGVVINEDEFKRITGADVQ